MTATHQRIDYLTSARRHCKDADTLMSAGGRPNAGQLYGLSVECGLKAVLVQRGAPTDGDGNLAAELRLHLPRLATEITTLLDGRAASTLAAAVPHLTKLHDWKIEHRYWRAKEVPLASLVHWQAAAREMLTHLDDMTQGAF